MLSRLIYTLFKITFRTVEVVVPALAGRWAIRLFFKPMRYQRPGREKAFLAKAAVQKLPFTGMDSRPSGESTYTVYRWGQGPKVLLAHGWAGRGTQMGFFIEPLVAAGYEVIAFDAPAHGDSSGQRTNVVEFAQVVKEIGQEVGGFTAIVGHSLGGIASGLAVQEGVRTEKLVTISSPSQMEYVLSSFAEQINASEGSIRYLRDYITTLAHRDPNEFSLSRIVTRIRVPGLIIHDQIDRNISYEQGKILAASWPDSTFISTEGLGHNRILRDPNVIASVVDFIEADKGESDLNLPTEKVIDRI
jgi:pimeloyl-ACP methyl ester carboxylesterase